MPDVVGTDTLWEGDLPEGVANYSSLAAFAAKTAEDWQIELAGAEETRWGGGVLGGLFAGLQQGKPFIAALIEALIREAFPDYDEVVANVETAFIDFASLFNGKWRDIVAAKDAADYANAQLAIQNRPIKDLFDKAAGNLDSTLWDVDYFDSVGGLAGGEVQEDGRGNCWWDGFGISARTGRCRYKAADTATDDQIVTGVMPLRVQSPAPLTGNSYMRFLLRVNAANTEYVYGEVTHNGVKLGYRKSGTSTQWASTLTAVQDGDVWDFHCRGSYFVLERNGVAVIDFDDTSGVSQVGSGHRYVGFEMYANSRGLLGQTSPGTLAVFSADDY